MWNLVPFADSLSYEEAALCEPAAVSLHAVSLADIKQGDNVVVVGTGTIGFLIATFAKNKTVSGKVIICGRSANKLEYAEKLGFDTINTAEEKIADGVKRITGADGADVTIEAVGSNKAIENAILATGALGKIILVGNPYEDLSIEKNLNEGLKDLLDRGFVLRSEAESFLRMTPEEQRIAAQMLQQLYAIAYNGPGSAAIQDEKKAIRGRFVDALRTVADTSSMQDAHEALVAAVFTVQKEMAYLKETIRKVKTIPPEQPAAQVEQTEVIREVREKTASAKVQSKITGKLSSQTSRLETMLRRKNPEKRLAEKYTHEERQQAMKELDEMIATATRLREIIAKVERSADETEEV